MPEDRTAAVGRAVHQCLVESALRLAEAVDKLTFSPPVDRVYNPLRYAWAGHAAYLERFGCTRKRVVWVGMNPGPWGMAQTGVPFGEVAAVKDWMGIDVPVQKPVPEHVMRPVDGFSCKRSEVSGRRLWGFFAEAYPDAASFFSDQFVLNYCPLLFMEDSGRNRTPDKLPSAESEPLYRICDAHLRAVLIGLQPEWVIGLGKFAAARARAAVPDGNFKVEWVLHPSPASPAANRDWAGQVRMKLASIGLG
jgi:single-strand selective monofunctional uracil DNA glycosylase